MVAEFRIREDLSLDVITKVVMQAREFESNIQLIKENHQANVKSILGFACVACSALRNKAMVRLDVCGNDEKEAFKAIQTLLN